MTARNKQALREAAIRAGGGNWIYIRTLSLSNAYITEETGATVINCTAGDVPAKCAGFLELANPATVLALLDELETKEEQRANWFQMAQKLGEDLDAAEKRIAELEAREVELPKPISVLHRRDFNDVHRAIYAYPEAELNAALATAGIGVKGE